MVSPTEAGDFLSQFIKQLTFQEDCRISDVSWLVVTVVWDFNTPTWNFFINCLRNNACDVMLAGALL
jgi:hypothetical protein